MNGSDDPYEGVDPKSFLDGLVEGYNKRFEAALADAISSVEEITLIGDETPDSERVRVSLSEVIERIIGAVHALHEAKKETDCILIANMMLTGMLVTHVFKFNPDAIANFARLEPENYDDAPPGTEEAIRVLNNFGEYLTKLARERESGVV